MMGPYTDREAVYRSGVLRFFAPLTVCTSVFATLLSSCSSNDSASPPGPRPDLDASTGGTLASGGAGGHSAGGSGTGGSGGAGGSPSNDDSGAPHREGGANTEDAAPRDASTPRHLDFQVFYDRSFAAHVNVDSKGAAVVSGTFFDTKDITLGTTTLHSHGAADLFLSRVLPNGTVDFAKGYGGTAEDYPLNFVLGAGDAITLTGLYNGTGNVGGPDFPAFAGTAGRYDVFVAGLDAVGTHRWSKTIDGNQDVFAGPGLSLDASGNVWVTGNFLGTANIGGVAHVSNGSWDGFLARYDEPNGTLSTVATFGDVGDDRGVAALFDGTDVLVVGRFQGSVTFATSPTPTIVTSAGGTDLFVARYSTSGTPLSAVGFGGTADEDVTTARLDADGALVLAGTYRSPSLSVLGGPALSNSGGNDFFVAKLTKTLAHDWSRGFGGDQDDYARDVAIGTDGTIAVAGEFRNSITLDGQTWTAARDADAGATEIDFLVLEMSPRGDVRWSFAAGGAAPDRALNVALDRAAGLWVTAAFQSPIDLGGGQVLTPDPGQWASALVRYAP